MDRIQENDPVNPASDKELAAGAQAGSRRCFEELIRRYSIRLFHYLRPRTPTDQDAEDLVQETLLKAYRNIDRFRPPYRFSTWIYTIANRLLISFFRKNKETNPPLDPGTALWNPEELYVRKEETARLWSMARELPPHQYQVILLKFCEGMSVKEISRIMKKSQVSVLVQLHRARRKLIEQSRPMEGGDAEEPASLAGMESNI